MSINKLRRKILKTIREYDNDLKSVTFMTGLSRNLLKSVRDFPETYYPHSEHGYIEMREPYDRDFFRLPQLKKFKIAKYKLWEYEKSLQNIKLQRVRKSRAELYV